MKSLIKSLAIAKKDVLMYYTKGPVVIFGILLPLFLFLAFSVGRSLPLNFLIAGLISMTVFFASTSVSPAIAPWEGQMRTLERLISCPIDEKTIILGDIIASMTFGVSISAVPILIGVVIGLIPSNPVVLLLGIIASAFCFSCLGLLFSAYPTNLPSTVMMISSLIRFPLIFISGIFIPVSEMPEWSRILAYLSPLTYFTDIARYSFDLMPAFPIYVDLLVITAFSALFLALAVELHKKAIYKRI